jgi:hypothetical protein
VHGDRGPDRGESVAADTPEVLTWSVRPCARNPLLAGVVVAFVLVLSLAVQVVLHSTWWGAVALLLLGLSVAPYYVGATYRLSEEGAAASGLFGTHRRAWVEVKGCFPDGQGVLLSPLGTPTRLAYTRGLYLRFADNRDEVLTRVEAFMEQATGECRVAAPGD